MRISLFLIAIISLAGCIKQVKLDYRTPTPTLVVDGLLLTDSSQCKVTLSYSGIFNENGGQLPDYIDDAMVYVFDDSGDSVQLSNIAEGNYIDEYSLFHAQVDHTYFIKINLSNGEKYASVPERIVPVPKNFELDSIGLSVPKGFHDLYGAEIMIRTQDPANEINYYRWTATDYTPRKATGFICNAPGNPPVYCDQYCYQFYKEPEVRIFSDANINGNEIRKQPVMITPYYYSGYHYVQIKQLSLTQEAYQFWKLYIEQTTRTGTILDPLPSQLQGNIYNVDKPDQLALGYFEASDVVTKNLVLLPYFVNAYYTLAHQETYIYPEEGSCWNVYPNAVQYAPPGWENLPPIKYDVY